MQSSPPQQLLGSLVLHELVTNCEIWRLSLLQRHVLGGGRSVGWVWLARGAGRRARCRLTLLAPRRCRQSSSACRCKRRTASPVHSGCQTRRGSPPPGHTSRWQQSAESQQGLEMKVRSQASQHRRGRTQLSCSEPTYFKQAPGAVGRRRAGGVSVCLTSGRMVCCKSKCPWLDALAARPSAVDGHGQRWEHNAGTTRTCSVPCRALIRRDLAGSQAQRAGEQCSYSPHGASCLFLSAESGARRNTGRVGLHSRKTWGAAAHGSPRPLGGRVREHRRKRRETRPWSGLLGALEGKLRRKQVQAWHTWPAWCQWGKVLRSIFA